MDVNARREAAEALRAIKRGGEGWYSLSDAVLGRPAPRDEVVARLAELIDPGEDVSMSAYDLLPEEDRETLRWVKESGGIDAVQKEVSNYAALCRSIQDADNRRAELCSALGIDSDTGWSDAMAEMLRRLMPSGFEWTDAFADAVDFMDCIHDLLYTIDGDEHTSEEMFADIMKRLMPEGMEWLLGVWPRWSNGEYCRFGDWWTADRYGDYEPRQLRRLVIYTPELLDEWEQGDGESYGYEWDFMRPSELDYRPDKVEPPAPAVPAADGEPLEVGQTVYVIANGKTHHVTEIDTVSKRFRSMEQVDGSHWLDPMCFTHQRPVLDADGVPIKVGDTVYFTDGREQECNTVVHAKYDYKGEPYVQLGRLNEADYPTYTNCSCIDPSQLTHKKPEPHDSWERIEFDLRKGYIEYWGCSGCSCSDCPSAVDGKRPMGLFDASCKEAMHKDIVRRCKALAEKGETE